MLEVIKQTADHLKEKTNFKPQIGIILGTGLGGLVKEINIAHAISYEDIPNFPVSTVEGHKGQLIFGDLGGKRVVAMQGRFHFYEGYSMNELVFPVRVMKFLGIEKLMVSNASGGVNPDFEIGDIMLISDHINLFPTNPLMGPNMNELGPRFPDMSQAYSKDILKTAEEVAKELDIYVVKGIYAGLSGPTLETPAEYQYVRNVGADAVGMSTVPEVIAANHAGIKCCALSVLTDECDPDDLKPIDIQEIITIAKKAEKKLVLLVKEFFKSIA